MIVIKLIIIGLDRLVKLCLKDMNYLNVYQDILKNGLPIFEDENQCISLTIPFYLML